MTHALRRLVGWPRATRGVLLGWLVANNVGVAALDWLAFGGVRLTFNLVPRFELTAPWWRAAALLALGAMVFGVAVARLHDLSLGGWWLLVLLALAAFALVVPAAGLVLLAAWLALLLWPGRIGPNRFGPDPRGWESQAHYDRQRAELSSRSEVSN